MRFVVRQPIFGSGEQVAGYRLNIEEPRGGDAVNPELVLEPVKAALTRIPAQSWAMVECGLEVLRSAAVRTLPAHRVVLAVSGEERGDGLLLWMRELRKEGYQLGTLQFERDAGWELLLPLLDWVAVRADVNGEELRRTMAAAQMRGVRLIAGGLATREQLNSARQFGFRYFEGPYYLTPSQELPREVPASKLACLRLLAELQQPELRLGVLEELVKAEPSFCYRLMRYMNSAAFFGLQKITSIRHAMALLGDDQLRRWFSLMAVAAAGDGHPSEVVMCAMLRARLCEVLSPGMPEEGFVTGLFSLMPLVVNMQLQALLSVVRLPSAVDCALRGEPGPLHTLLNLAVAFERAQWQVVRDLADSLGCTEEQVFAARGEASQWANEILATQATAAAKMA